MEIYGFMHVYMVNDWEEIINGQLFKMKNSGLWDKMDQLLVGYIDSESLYQTVPEIFKDDKIRIMYCSKDPTIYESLTLANLQYTSWSVDGYVFYIHTKGVTKKGNPFQKDWRELMEYFIIERYELCLRELENNDIVGINWHFGEGHLGAKKKYSGGIPITPHFSGNFWWATTDYIRRLPNLIPIEGRYNCEFWIGKEFPKVVEVWNMGKSPHKTLYPKYYYVGKESIKYFNYNKVGTVIING